MTEKDELLLEINKKICTRIKELPSVQPDVPDTNVGKIGDLIDRRAAIDEMKARRDSAKEWYDNADEDSIRIRADSAMASFIECILTLQKLPSAQPNTDHIYAELSKAYNVPGLPDEAIGIIGDLMLSLDEPSAQPEWNNHTVACLLAELFDDTCACNYNGIDEWLPEKCELLDSCPNPGGVACWEQFLKHKAERRTDERQT